jgi:hypothetical protein
MSNSNSARRWSSNKVNLWFDIAIFIAALFAPAVAFTGLAIHEWLGIGLGLAVVTHLLLHWQWIAQTTKRLFGHTNWSARLNYLVNWLFFIDLTIITVTGILISEVALRQVGITLPQNGMAHPLHTLSADAMVFILALHVGLHGKWIVSTANRYLVQPVVNIFHRTGHEAGAPALPKEGVA